MPKTLHTAAAHVIALVTILVGGYGAGWAADTPHKDYTPRYQTGICGGTNQGACHDYNKVSFLPVKIDTGPQTDFTNFCLSCHNASGEAHERSAGSPSTNAYPNLTGIYGGDSHSWRGVVGNAGTVVPTLPGFIKTTDGTDHMPGGNKVTCQVCHGGMAKSGEQNVAWVEATSTDQINYTILGYSSTKQYLAGYLRVYRDAGLTSTAPGGRAKKAYLVAPSEYTYINASAIVRFKSVQNSSDKVYVDIGQPYFRDTNEGNEMCLTCHTDRTSGSVSHEPGAGADNSHPVVVGYGFSGGLNDTLKPSADGNIYIEGGQVLCTSCHDPHNAASDDGQLTRSANSSELCTDCHKTNGFDGYSTQAVVANHNGSKHSAPTECLDCHTTHKTTNILLIKTKINGKTINFQNFSGANSFGNDTGDSVCEACHTATGHHLASNDVSGQDHHTGDRCTKCHTHASGFGGGGCSDCHAFPPDSAGPFLVGWNDRTGDAHVSHKDHLETILGLSGNAVCMECHGPSIPRADHSNQNAGAGKPSAGVETTTWTSWTGIGGDWGAVAFDIGTTIGMVNTADDTCANVSCHSSSGTRVWGASDCDSCHSYPVAGSNWASSAHTVQYDGITATHLPATGYDAKNDDYVTMTTDVTRCGKCHYNSLGTTANHRNETVNLQASGNPACGPATAFTINQTAPGVTVTCSNVKCHTANKATPNWY